MPFVLRHYQDTLSLLAKHHLLEAQGIMDGEAIDGAKADGRVPTDFILV